MPTPKTIEARMRVAQPIALAIAGVKASLNDSMAQIGHMLVGIADARTDTEARFPLGVTVDAVDHAAELLASMSRTYRQAIITHGALSVDKAELGLKTVAWGDWFPTPTKGDLERVDLEGDLARALAAAESEAGAAGDDAKVVAMPGRVAA